MNPDEVVAVGAAIQAGVLSGEVDRRRPARRDPAVAGHRDPGRREHQADRAQHDDPDQEVAIFTTADDGQTSVDIHVVQGEREMAGDNKTMGRFRLEGIPPAPRGVPQVEVSFDIDANGIVSVSAKDLGTGREQRITITSSTNLSKDEVDRMVREAEALAAEDKRKKDEAEVRNAASSLIYSTENRSKKSATSSMRARRPTWRRRLPNSNGSAKTARRPK